MPLVIAQAVYSHKDDLAIPHFTGEFNMVDCTLYMRKKRLKTLYDKEKIEIFLENTYLIYDDIKYYATETYLIDTDKLYLESDLSKLVHNNEEF